MKKNPLDYLTQIALRWVTTEHGPDEFRALGVNPREWPEGHLKLLVSAFEKEVETHGRIFAMKQAAQMLETLELTIDESESPKNLARHEKEFITRLRVNKLAEALKADALNFQELLNDFNAQLGSSVKLATLLDVVKDTMETCEKRISNNSQFTEIPKWKILSREIDGFEGGRIALLSAVSGYGKTNIAFQLAVDASEVMPVLFINQEMLDIDLGARHISNEVNITRAQIRNGAYLDQGRAQKTQAMLNKAHKNHKVFVTSGCALSLEDICAATRALKASEKIKILIVDYDQKIKLKLTKGQAEWEAMLKAMETLEELAKELDIFVLVLAQANESGDPKSSKRAIQPASVHMHFFADENKTPILELKKNRFGKQGVKIEIEYTPEYSRVSEKGIFETGPRGQSQVFKIPRQAKTLRPERRRDGSDSE